MSKNMTNFNKRVEDIAERAHVMRELCVNSQFDARSGEFIADEATRAAAIDAVAATMPMFESLSPEHRVQVVTAMASSVAEFERTYGELPRDEVLAAAHKSMEGMLLLEGKSGDSEAAMMMESIGKSLSSSEGVELRAKMVGLVLPTMLATATSDAVTYVPAQNDEIEIFRIHRIASTNFGDFKRGTRIDEETVGQYSQMRQRYPFVQAQQPDGVKKEFTFTAKTDLPNTSEDIPFKKGTVNVYFNRRIVARDFEQKNGLLYGRIELDGGEAINVNGTIDYNTGAITVTTSDLLPTGSELHAEFEIDIEAKPELIPTIDHEMESCKLRPSQSAIAVDASIQAMFAMTREYGVDLKSMQMSHMRNFLANEKARKHLRDMDFACRRSTSFNLYVPDGEDWKLHREKLHEKLLNISQQLLKATRVSGLRGVYAGVQASTVLKSLGAPFFTPAPNYKQTNEVHYAGLVFGTWKVFEAPIGIKEWDILCYARGNSHSEAGYVASDAIPATMYNHPIGTNLRARNTLWELAYGEIHPFGGSDYFLRLTLVNEKPEEAPTEAQREAA